MASKTIEDIHQTLLDKLLTETGLECLRPAPESLETSTEIGELEEQEPTPEVAEEHVPEEETEAEKEDTTEEIQEESPEIFPTPSLRHVLPDRIRKIEEYNRIHVLPDEFRTDIDPAMIPKIAQTAAKKYIDILAEIVGCKRYKSSLAEYWFLDTLANLLRRAQEDGLNRSTQAVLIQWFCEWMKEIQNFDAADRQRMLKRFQDNMLSAARFIATQDRIPTPTEVGVTYKSQENQVGHSPPNTSELKPWVTFEGAAYDCSLRDLTKIIHYIFDLFSTDYQYNLVRSVFTFSPEYILIDGPFQLQKPKRLYAPLKPKKEKSPKKDTKSAQKGKKQDTEEYLAFLEMKARHDREQEEKELKDMERWNRQSHILPLNFGVEDDFFEKYWPSPVLEPEPEAEIDSKKKTRGKKK